jgi:mono/diheme cytochrome c family protein
MSSSQNDYNKGGMITFALSMVASVGVMIYVSFFSGGIDLKEIPKDSDVSQTQAAAPAPAEKPVDISGVKDPWNPTPDVIAHGKQVFKTNCALCHGQDGKGDGPAGVNLNPRPRNFVEGKWKKGGTRLGIFDVIQNGLAGSSMVSFKHLPVADRWSLVNYIRSITQNKVADNQKEVDAKAPTLK